MLRPPPILAYHGLRRIAPELDPHHLMLDPDRLERQVRVLKGRDYDFVTVSQFVHRSTGTVPPSGLCALTFDDGTADHALVLPELLERLDVPATLYVCPGLLGRASPFVDSGAGIRLMDAEELRSLARNPRFEIGSHTRTHVALATASAVQAFEEMAASKAELEDVIEREVATFAYPECAYSPPCPEAAARAGYLAAVTCGPRGSWQRYELQRQAVHRRDNRLTFELKSRALWYPVQLSAVGTLVRRTSQPFRLRR